MTTDKPMTVEALMTLVNRYAEACDDLGTDLFAQDATKHAALHEAASAVYAQIHAAIEQYGKEQYARGVNDAWPKHKNGWTPVYGKWGGNDSFRCNTCDAEFTSAYAAAAHCATEHPQDIEQVVPATAFEPLTDEQERAAFDAWFGERPDVTRPACFTTACWERDLHLVGWMARAHNIRSAK